ncbi:MAG: hypothetical protein AAF602_18660 [Myxococcota bacterium]
MMWWLWLVSPAESGTLVLSRKGLVPVRAWVDGVARGPVRSARKPLSLELPEGSHEVWFSADDPGVVTLCHGLVDVPAVGEVAAQVKAGLGGLSCVGLRDGWPGGPTAFRGAFVSFQVDVALDAWVSIDGGAPLAFPAGPFQLNLAPGPHTVVVYQDPDTQRVFDQGTVTLLPGQQLVVTCTTAGCLGFDVPPVFITEVYAQPELVLATPGVRIDFDLDIDAPGVRTSLDVRVDAP